MYFYFFYLSPLALHPPIIMGVDRQFQYYSLIFSLILGQLHFFKLHFHFHFHFKHSFKVQPTFMLKFLPYHRLHHFEIPKITSDWTFFQVLYFIYL